MTHAVMDMFVPISNKLVSLHFVAPKREPERAGKRFTGSCNLLRISDGPKPPNKIWIELGISYVEDEAKQNIAVFRRYVIRKVS